MDISEIKQRLELALRLEKPPSIEEVLEQVSTHGVLRGPVDWVFPGWMLYVEYATQKIAETFQLSEEERSQLLDFRDTLKRLLQEAWIQAKEKLEAVYKAIKNGTYRIEGKRLYAPDGAWIYIGATPHLKIHGVTAKARFPDVLKLPRERLELFQLGWRASDEYNNQGRPAMDTVQPWQVFAWAATRYGALYIRIAMVNLTQEGVSVLVHLRANSWRQRWDKDKAADLTAGHLRNGEWAPVLTAWLGDGRTEWRDVLQGIYKVIITSNEPWRLGISIGTRKALVATGKESFVKLRESAGVYGELLDLLKAHKWVVVKLATDDSFRVVYKQNKKSIKITVEDVIMYPRVVGGTLLAEHYTGDLEKARVAAERLKSAGFRPNVVKSSNKYVVYIAMTDLLKLAERDGEIRRDIAQYLAEKAKNGTPKQRKIAEKILKRHPFFRPDSWKSTF
jgi:hypothetical protein